jgi:hypothetical protein
MTKKLSHEEYSNRVFELVGDEYTILDKYIDTRTKILTRHNTCGNEYFVSPNKFFMGRRCPKCARILIANDQRKSFNTLYKQIKEITNNEFELIGGNYLNHSSKIIVLHKKCNRKFNIVASNFLTRKKCGLCAKDNMILNNTKSQEQFCNEIYEKYGNEYSIIGNYIFAREKVLVKHNSCGNEWYVTPSNLLRGYGCPICKESKGEKRIRKFLEQNKINFTVQKTFDNLLGIGSGVLKFDFCVFDLFGNILSLIEYQGEQHSNPIKFFGGFDAYCRLNTNDAYKRYYCSKNNLKLLEIKQKDYNNIEKILESEIIPLERRNILV